MSTCHEALHHTSLFHQKRDYVLVRKYKKVFVISLISIVVVWLTVSFLKQSSLSFLLVCKALFMAHSHNVVMYHHLFILRTSGVHFNHRGTKLQTNVISVAFHDISIVKTTLYQGNFICKAYKCMVRSDIFKHCYNHTLKEEAEVNGLCVKLKLFMRNTKRFRFIVFQYVACLNQKNTLCQLRSLLQSLYKVDILNRILHTLQWKMKSKICCGARLHFLIQLHLTFM